MSRLEFHIIQHNSAEYHQAISLRQAILRTPLGLVYGLEDLALEVDQIHIIGKIEQEILCSASIQKFEDFCKIRQVAVKNDLQKSGMGTLLMNFCEQYIKRLGFKRIELHARMSVINFYIKNGYSPIGEEFLEINIPHQKMQKWLNM